jgi:hypothetical protein
MDMVQNAAAGGAEQAEPMMMMMMSAPQYTALQGVVAP